MSTLAYPNAVGTNSLHAYTRNVGRAARLLWSALLARKPVQIERQRQKQQAILMLNGMARDLEASMPNLSAELRYLAARG